MGALILPSTQPALRFLQNFIGAVPSAYDCWLAQWGTKTLHLQMKQHGLNALAVARASPGVEEVIYPGLPGKTDDSRRKHQLAWNVLSPHARRFIQPSGTEDLHVPPPSDPSTVLFCSGYYEEVYQKVINFYYLVTSTRLFMLAESLGCRESSKSL
jgi:cystathionine gamma-lyase